MKTYGHTGRFLALREAMIAKGCSRNDLDVLDWTERDFNDMVESRDLWKRIADADLAVLRLNEGQESLPSSARVYVQKDEV